MLLTEFAIKVGYFVADIIEGYGWIEDDRIEIEQQFNEHNGKSLSDERYQMLYTALKDYNLLYDSESNALRYNQLFNEGKTDETCQEMEDIRNKLCDLFNAQDFNTGLSWLITEEEN